MFFTLELFGKFTYYIRRWTFLFVSAFSWGVLWYGSFYKLIDDQLLVGLAGFAISALVGFFKQSTEDNKLTLNLIDKFNEAYTSDINDLFHSLEYNLNNLTQLNFEQKNIIIDYMNLSAEEFLWFRRGLIPPVVWKSWKNGINYNLGLTGAKEVVLDEMKKSSRGSYYGLNHFFQSINQINC